MAESEPRTFTVALDAMGGDYGPPETVTGALEAAQETGVRVLLVGDEHSVGPELARRSVDGAAVEIVPSEGLITETDQPLQAMREKPRASIVRATEEVKAGNAHAVVSMGSTGASMASAALVLGMLEGVERPAIGGPVLGPLSHAVILDLGSNIDCRTSQLLGFGAIGTAFARRIQGIEIPRVALLSVGAEEGKGNRQVRDAYFRFLRSPLNFVGNIEGGDLLQDKADVVVCDGFVGNVLLKFAEGLGTELAARLSQLVGAHMPADVMQRVGSRLSGLTNAVDLAGGGPLFGVNGVSIVGHGRSRAASIASAIRMAKKVWDADLVGAMERDLAAIRGHMREAQ